MRRTAIHPASPDRSSGWPSPAPAAGTQPAGSGARPMAGAAGTVLLLHALLVVLFTLMLAAEPRLRLLFNVSTLRGAAFGALLMQGGFILVPTLLVMRFARARPQQVAGGSVRPGSLVLAFLAGIPAAIVLSGLNNLLLFLLSQSGIRLADRLQDAFTLDLDIRTPAELLLIAMISILLPAIAEELMFRGLIQGSLRERAGEGMTIALQAFAFMVFHASPAFLLPPFMAGLLLGLIRSRTGSLIPAIAAHLSLNATLALITAFLPRFTERLLEITTQSSRSLLYVSVMAACLAAVALVPLIILIAGGQPDFRYRRQRDRRLPADLPFVLATLLLIATIIFRYFNP